MTDVFANSGTIDPTRATERPGGRVRVGAGDLKGRPYDYPQEACALTDP